MAYNSNLKADSELFDQIEFIPVSDQLILRPIIPEIIESEANLYLINSRNDAIKKYLPAVYVETLEQAKEKLYDFIQRMLLRHSILYCIRPKEQQIPIGYIHINSPIARPDFESWSIEFWLGKGYGGRGIMTASIAYLLAYLQQKSIPEILALVDTKNIKSINILEKIGFINFDQEEGGDMRLLYKIKL